MTGPAGRSTDALGRAGAQPTTAPSSLNQQRLYFLQQMDPSSSAYTILFRFAVDGPLDVEALRRGLDGLVGRHEVLRTVFAPGDGGDLEQVIGPPDTGCAWRRLSFDDLPALQASERAGSVLEADATTPFDLEAGPLLRATLVKVSISRHLLQLSLHHIITDGWTNGLLLSQLSALYAAEIGHGAGESPGSGTRYPQYQDFARWQHKWLSDERIAAESTFWVDRLTGFPTVLELPTDLPRPQVESHRGAVEVVLWPDDLRDALHACARRERMSVFMVGLAAVGAVLSRYARQERLIVGSPTMYRPRREFEQVAGLCLNTLAYRLDLTSDPSFRELLAQVRDEALEAYAHQELPFERVVDLLRPKRDLSRSPVVQVLFKVDGGGDSFTLAGTEVTPLPADAGTAKFDLSFFLSDGPDGLYAGCEYSTDLFHQETVQELCEHLRCFLTAALGEPGTPVSRIPLAAGRERSGGGTVSRAWRQPHHALVPELFVAQACRTPDAVAVVDGDGRTTYRELHAEAAKLAAVLAASGAGADTLVGVALPRGRRMVAAVLAIWLAGAAYVPLDLSHPEQRLLSILDDSGVTVVVTSRDAATVLPGRNGLRLVLAEGDGDGARQDGQAGAYTASSGVHDPDAAAYVLYTSGTTGTPKGVVVTHGGVENVIAACRDLLEVDDSCVWLACTPLGFDISVPELFTPLTVGGRVVIASDTDRMDAETLLVRAAGHGITHLQATPTGWRLLLFAGFDDPSVVASTAGEALTPALAADLRPRTKKLVNLYGPTECSVYATSWHVPDSPDVSRIGVPLPGTAAHSLDRWLTPVPAGFWGELFLTGVGLARGYLGRPGKTAECFLPDPLGPPGSRMYRTGDLGRWRPDGTIEFGGRLDDQVKIRGYRIELGEVEAAVLSHPEVTDARVVVAGDTDDRYLAAYIVPASRQDREQREEDTATGVGRDGDDTEELIDSLPAHLRQRLPEYMLPATVTALPRIPLSANGKLDRRALPAPRKASARAGRRPQTLQQEVLCGLFADVLGVPQVSIDDGFFELGGNSLQAIRLVGMIRDTLSLPVPLRSLFEAQSVADLAERLRRPEGDDAFHTLLTLRANGDRSPLFCFHPAGGLGWPYFGLLRHLDPARPVYALQARELDDRGTHPASVRAMADDYLDEILAVRPDGPYHLLGWSFGGLVAHAVATELQRRGVEVDTLTMLDSHLTIAATSTGPRLTEEQQALLILLELAGVDAPSAHPDDLAPDRLRLLLRSSGQALGSLSEERLEAFVVVFRENIRLTDTFRPDVFDGDLLHFAAVGDDGAGRSAASQWGPYVSGRIEDHAIACGHHSMLRPAPLAQIAPVIVERLGGR